MNLSKNLDKLSFFKKILVLSLIFFSCQLSKAQVISVEKIATFSIDSLNAMVASAGLPAGIVVPEYEIDLYKVRYLSPYIYLDSLVQVSGAIAMPKNPSCPLPLIAYSHGTQTKKSKVASRMDGGQWDINTIMASTGYVVCMTDYLGLGDSDPKITMAPYSHAFSESYANINILRSARHLSDSMNINLNGQIFLYGYSQGGAATVSTVKEIQLNYPNEFNVVASAPMSGAYDFVDAQVDLIASTNPYPTPAYFPYIIFSYQSVYKNMFTSPSEFLKSPYDTLLAPLYYAGNTNLGTLNNLCDPVPRNMVIDSVMNEFLSNPNHPMRLNLLDNDLIRGWFPTSPMRLLYCQGDDQVTYLNSENAFAAWTAAGAPSLEKEDLGGFNHNGCAPFALINAKNYFDSYKDDCSTGFNDLHSISQVNIRPNPANDKLVLNFHNKEDKTLLISMYNGMGQVMIERTEQFGIGNQELTLKTTKLSDGLYFLKIYNGSGALTKKVVIQH